MGSCGRAQRHDMCTQIYCRRPISAWWLRPTDPVFHNVDTRFFALRLDLQFLDDLPNGPACGTQLASAFNPAIVMILLAGMRTGEPIRSVDPGCQAKKLVTASAFFERPGAVKCDGELANHGAHETAGTEDKLRPTVRFRPDHPGSNRLAPHLQHLQPVIKGITKEPAGRAG